MTMAIIEKFDYVRSKKLMDSARDQDCQNCARNGSTVSAHSNASVHGKAGAIKSSDIFIAWLCQECHDWYDAGRGRKVSDPTGIWTSGERQEMWRAAHDKTLRELFLQGFVIIK